MGVLACNKNQCENIMCDRYSYEYGYLCWECFEELCDTRPLDIRAWMGYPKVVQASERSNYEEIFVDRSKW